MSTKAVLIKDSIITCGHPSPGAGGKLALAAVQDVLTIDGAAVLLDSLSGVTIAAGCSQLTTNATPNDLPCSVVSTQDKQLSTVLKVNGTFVLLHETSGTSNGKPKNDWSSTDAKQDVLKAD